MCGIAGVIKWKREVAWPSEEGVAALGRMSEAIRHRGPDGAGKFIDPRAGAAAALVHRRLAVIDRPGGAQPMGNEDGSVQVVFNGEIYNHAALRRELAAAGHVFASDHSDTEVLVHGWEEWGVELPKRLVGMFAFGIWDMRTGGNFPRRGKDAAAAGEGGTLFLARDRMGQKPLFYANLEDGIVFGSTINSVLAWPGVPRRVPREQIGVYLLLGYFPAGQSVYRDVSQVLPGAWLRLRNDVLDGQIYWRGGASAGAVTEAMLRDEVQRAVGSQCAADVPVACFLSGGIDSSIVAAEMQRAVLAAGGEPIHTVSVGFAHAGFDETRYAQIVADHIGSRHTRLEVGAGSGDGDVVQLLRFLMATSLGQPFADSSVIPTYHLSRAVREIATVALSGDGADELFGGYDRYRAMGMLSRWRSLARLMPRASPVGSVAKRERYRRLAAAARARSLSQRYSRLVEIFPLELAERVLGEPILDFSPEPEEMGIAAGVSPLRLAMMRDRAEYLPGDVLWKVDCASMCTGLAGSGATALEVRAPFLDHRVVEMAAGLADRDLIRGEVGKWILREAFRGNLPAEILRRGKKGFGVPIGEWFRNQLKGALTDYLLAGDSFTSRHLCNGAVEGILREHVGGQRDHGHRLFALLMLEIWWQGAGATVEE